MFVLKKEKKTIDKKHYILKNINCYTLEIVTRNNKINLVIKYYYTLVTRTHTICSAPEIR